MSDAQSEAERIVDNFAWSAEGLFYRGGPSPEAMTAVLAAAIEVDAELSAERWADDPVTAEERTHRAGRKLHSALGEVRGGEGPR